MIAAPYRCPLQTRMHAMPTEMEQCDTLVANLKQQLARGGMSYYEAVVVDDIISILATVRSQTGEELETPDRAAPQPPSP